MANTRKRYGWITTEPCFADRVLNAICLLGPCNREELLGYLRESKSSVYPTITRMVENGFVEETNIEKLAQSSSRELEATNLGLAKRNMMMTVYAAAKIFESEKSGP